MNTRFSDADFIEWCFNNKELIELIARENNFSFEDITNARSKIWSRGIDVSAPLFSNIVELYVLREIREREEVMMYAPIAEALGGEVLGGPSQPDCVVNGIPVEAKNKPFNQSALKQLRRYMQAMHTSRGIAAAPECSIALPKNILYLQVSYNPATSSYEIKNVTEALEWIKNIDSSNSDDLSS